MSVTWALPSHSPIFGRGSESSLVEPSARVLSFCCTRLSSPLLKRLLKGEGGAAEHGRTLADGSPGRPFSAATSALLSAPLTTM